MISNGVWSSSNAKTLLDYASSKGYYLDFELGNGRIHVCFRKTVNSLEPENYRQARGNFISGDIIAADYKSLRSLLNSYPIYASSLLFGTSESASPGGMERIQLIMSLASKNSSMKFQLFPF